MSHAPFAQPFAHGIYKQKYAHPGEEWGDTAMRVPQHVLSAIGHEGTRLHQNLEELIEERKFIPGGRYLYAAGRDLHQTQNCLLLRCGDTREGWSDLKQKASMALMTGAGIGVDYSDVRPSGSIISRTGGVASGPLSVMNSINEIGRNVMQGGARRSAIWAGLSWKHADIYDFIDAKNYPEWMRKMKQGEPDKLKAEMPEGTPQWIIDMCDDASFNFPCPLDCTNVSVILDDEFFEAFNDKSHKLHERAQTVYRYALDRMVTNAEPGFSVDTGVNAGETLRNACTEVTSADDSDVCNLGSINIAAFDTKEEFAAAVKDATCFLIAGTVYSDLPYDDVYVTREKNRRLGLGIMGVHEWLMKRGKKYGPDAELGEWLAEYAKSGEYANAFADELGISRPVKTRAIAPTGTIGILAETTTGIEPVFCAAYKRRVRNASHEVTGDVWEHEYVVDPTVKRLLDEGVDPASIEDAYTLSYDVERRIEFQAWVQQFVDHGISSTVNIPYKITDKAEQADFASTLMKHLPNLRGITVYPDGAIGGQPLTPVDVAYALEHSGVRFEESEERCVGGACGV